MQCVSTKGWRRRGELVGEGTHIRVRLCHLLAPVPGTSKRIREKKNGAASFPTERERKVKDIDNNNTMNLKVYAVKRGEV